MSPNIKCFTPQEEERFLDTLGNRKDAERAYMLYHLMLITGLRLSEALSLNVEHASRAKIELKVKGWTKNRPEGRACLPARQGLAASSQGQGKKKDRFKTVYFPKALQGHLKDYLKVKAKRGESLLPGAPLFVSRNNAKGQKAMVCLPIGKARISPRQVQRDFKKWVKMSGIESNLSPHSLRHTVGTRLLKEFKNAKLVQRYLGHSDVTTTLRYYVDACPVQKSKILYGVFPEDLPPHQNLWCGGLEEAAEALAGKRDVDFIVDKQCLL